MREILFRGLRVDNLEWVKGNLVKWDDKCVIIPTGCSLQKINIGSNLYTTSSYEVIPETVGQFTGLLDKNWVKVFEGDIIAEQLNKEDNIIRKVSYHPGEFSMNPGLLSLYHKKHKIIGNIHEHAHLLET